MGARRGNERQARETRTGSEAETDRETKKNCRSCESPRHSKKPDAGGHPEAGPLQRLGCWGHARPRKDSSGLAFRDQE